MHPALARRYPASGFSESSLPLSSIAIGFVTGTPVSSPIICLALLAYPALGAGGGVRPSRCRAGAELGGSGERLERGLAEGDMLVRVRSCLFEN